MQAFIKLRETLFSIDGLVAISSKDTQIHFFYNHQQGRWQCSDYWDPKEAKAICHEIANALEALEPSDKIQILRIRL